MMDDKDQDRIERLLRAELSAEEESALREQAAVDKELAEELEFAEDLEKVAGFTGRANLKDRLQQLEQAKATKVPLRITWRRPLAVAASVMLVLGIAAAWYANKAYSDEALLTAYYEVPNFSGSRSETNTSSWEQITSAFYSKNYPQVEQLMAAHPDLRATKDGMHLLAHTYLQSNQIEKALAQIEQLPGSPAKDWLRVQGLLAAGEYASLKESLAKITATPNHPYYQEAVELLRKVNSSWRILI